MAFIRGYLEQRRKGWFAVVDVPPSLRVAVGRKRLRDGLGTRDRRVAEARLPKAALALNQRIEAAGRAAPSTDPVTQEAMALRETWRAVEAGDVDGWLVRPETMILASGEAVTLPPEAVARGILQDTIGNRAEAIAKEEGDARGAYFAALATGRVTPLKHHLEDWLTEGGQRQPYPSRTKADYRSILDKFADWLAETRRPVTVEAVSKRVAGEYVSAMLKAGLSTARTTTRLSALNAYWAWMQRRGVIAEDTASPWTGQMARKARAAVAPGKTERPFTDAEVVALLRAAPDPTLGDLMRFGALTGARIEEIANLTVARCAGGVFDVPGTKTDAAPRVIPQHPDLAAIVLERCKGKAPDAFIFHEFKAATHGERSPAVSKRFNRFREGVGVHEKPEGTRRSLVNFHSFRRWFATKAHHAGIPDADIGDVLGHKRKGMTLGRYAGKQTPERLRACVEAVRLPD